VSVLWNCVDVTYSRIRTITIVNWSKFDKVLKEGVDGVYRESSSLNFGYRQSWKPTKNLAWIVREKYCLSFQNTFQRFTVKIPKCYLLLPLKYQHFYRSLIFRHPTPPPPPPSPPPSRPLKTVDTDVLIDLTFIAIIYINESWKERNDGLIRS
jgi:hypothetical protein